MHNYLRFESRILKPGDGHSGSKRLTLADDIFISVNLGFGREAAENCALLGHYAASSDNFLQRFWVNLSVPSSGFKNQKKPEDENDRLSRNVGKKLQLPLLVE